MSRNGFVKLINELEINDKDIKFILDKLNALDKASFSSQGLKNLIHITDQNLTIAFKAFAAADVNDENANDSLEGNPVRNFVIEDRFIDAFESFFNVMKKHATTIDSMLKQNKIGERDGLFTDYDRLDTHINIDKNVVECLTIAAFLEYIEDLPLIEGAATSKKEKRKEITEENFFEQLERELVGYLEIWNPIRAYRHHKIKQTVPISFSKMLDSLSRFGNVLMEFFTPEELQDEAQRNASANGPSWDLGQLSLLNRKQSGNLREAEQAVDNFLTRSTIQNLIDGFNSAYKLEPTKKTQKTKEKEKRAQTKLGQDKMDKAINS